MFIPQSLDTINDLVHTLYQQEYEVKAGQSGSFSLTVDASSLFNSTSQPPPAANPFFLPSTPKKGLHISQMQIVQGIQTRLSSSLLFALTGMANVQGMGGYGVTNLTLQHTINRDQVISYTVLVGAQSKLAVEVAQALTHTLQGSVALGYGKQGTEVEMKVLQQISDQMMGTISVSLGDMLNCILHGEYNTQYSRSILELFVGRDLGMKLSHLHTLDKNEGTKAKLTLNSGVSDLSVEAMIGKDLTPFSKMNCAVVLGLKGISLKLKYQRGGMNFVLPILLSNSLTNPLAFFTAFSVPLILSGGWWWWKRSTRSAREKKCE